MTTTVPPGLAELTEIMAYADFATSASTSVREALGLASSHVGSTRALAIREDPSYFFNRAGGFGGDGPITVDDLARVCDFYRERGVPQGSLMIAPPLLPPDWAATAAKLDLAESSRFAKLGCDIDTLPTTDRALLTARVRAAEAAGCRWLVAETGVEGPGEHNPSLHNMLRVGFEPLYERANWLWRA